MLMAQEAQAMKRSLLLLGRAELNEIQEEELRQRQADKVLRLLGQTASRLHIYCDRVRLDQTFRTWDKGPFQVGEWAKPGPIPKLYDIWEGQMTLWIQSDILFAISQLNKFDDPLASLINHPCKRLISMEVLPEYVGITASGVFLEPPTDYTQAITDQRDAVSKALPDDFAGSPSGRKSNALYDVRHAKVVMIVDSKSIPQILSTFSNVNFMAVIGMDIEDVDEYEHLSAGYFYGENVDAVQITLNLETFWLRSWTAGDLTEEDVPADRSFFAGLMPDQIRYKLGLPPRAADFKVDEDFIKGGGSGGERGEEDEEEFDF
jgi:hypothetical protein